MVLNPKRIPAWKWRDDKLIPVCGFSIVFHASQQSLNQTSFSEFDRSGNIFKICCRITCLCLTSACRKKCECKAVLFPSKLRFNKRILGKRVLKWSVSKKMGHLGNWLTILRYCALPHATQMACKSTLLVTQVGERWITSMRTAFHITKVQRCSTGVPHLDICCHLFLFIRKRKLFWEDNSKVWKKSGVRRYRWWCGRRTRSKKGECSRRRVLCHFIPPSPPDPQSGIIPTSSVSLKHIIMHVSRTVSSDKGQCRLKYRVIFRTRGVRKPRGHGWLVFMECSRLWFAVWEQTRRLSAVAISQNRDTTCAALMPLSAPTADMARLLKPCVTWAGCHLRTLHTSLQKGAASGPELACRTLCWAFFYQNKRSPPCLSWETRKGRRERPNERSLVSHPFYSSASFQVSFHHFP